MGAPSENCSEELAILIAVQFYCIDTCMGEEKLKVVAFLVRWVEEDAVERIVAVMETVGYARDVTVFLET